MPKTRINKFIFQDGKTFLRLKTLADDLKVTKNGLNYKIEIPAPTPKDILISIPVIWIGEFSSSEYLKSDFELMGLDLSSFDETVVSKKTIWGYMFRATDLASGSQYYYLNPDQRNYAVRIGPIQKTIEDKRVEIDWENLQWNKD